MTCHFLPVLSVLRQLGFGKTAIHYNDIIRIIRISEHCKIELKFTFAYYTTLSPVPPVREPHSSVPHALYTKLMGQTRKKTAH